MPLGQIKPHSYLLDDDDDESSEDVENTYISKGGCDLIWLLDLFGLYVRWRESEINDRQERQRSGDFSPKGGAACRARRRGRSYCIRTIDRLC